MEPSEKQVRLGCGGAAIVAALVVIVIIGFQCFTTVPPGHVAVATLFGKVMDNTYPEGFHLVNPLYSFTQFDTRQKTHKEQVGVPSQDQLTTDIDVSVQWRVIGSMAAEILRETGQVEELREVHLVPKVRSLLREQGKSVPRAEDFFAETTQQRLQSDMKAGLEQFMTDRGIEIQAVLIRDIKLPPFINRAIESKKEREQEAEKQKAELERFRTEQQQKVAQAEAERQAAEEEAQKRRVLADAQAYEIEQINKAIADSPAYIQLQALKSLEAISQNPSSKIYFLDGSSPTPLPLMHLGDPSAAQNIKR